MRVGVCGLVTLKFIFGIKLHVSYSSSVRHQESFTVHTAVVYVIQLESRIRKEPFYSKNKFEKLVHLVGVMNVKVWCVFKE